MLPDIPSGELTDHLRTMLIIRRFEEALIKLAEDRDIGHFHVYVGQESTGVPALSLLGDGDLCFTTHRNHGHLLARGADPAKMIAEILGKKTGYNEGKGGTLHIASLEHGFPTTSAATGGCIPLATGAAFAFDRRGVDRVSVCLMGDGALEEGSWHESVNIAATESLPIIYLCENNSLEALGQKAGEYPSSTMAASPLTDLAEIFKMPSVAIDGTDTGVVYSTMKTAVDRARAGEGPTFIEARTVRWPGNRPLWPQLLTGVTDVTTMWDAGAIPEDNAVWHSTNDGMLGFGRELLAADLISVETINSIDAVVTDQIRDAIQFGLDSPYPEPEEALVGVFAGESR
jgi:TPP-dependent pyruvate/acetoin dehydrogenase alpha subunit